MLAPASELPEVALLSVFGLLTPEERYLAKQVCRSWHFVVNSRRRWRCELLTPRRFLEQEKFFRLAEAKLWEVPLSRLLLILCQPIPADGGERPDSEAIFFHLVETRKTALNPDIVKRCQELSQSKAITQWCGQWEPSLEDVRLYEAATSGSQKSARLAIRAGAVLVDWALCAAVQHGHVRTAVQMLKKGARDWGPGIVPQVEPHVTEHCSRPDRVNQNRAAAACRKWLRVCC